MTKKRKIIIMFIVIILTIAVTVCYVNFLRPKPTSSYIVAKEYFGSEKFKTFEKNELETNNTTIELKDLALSVLRSSFENSGKLPENFKNIVSEELFGKLNVSRLSYFIEENKNSKLDESCDFKIYRIYLNSNKAIVEYDYSYTLYDIMTNKILNSSITSSSLKKYKLFLELSNENMWIITDLLTYP
ncbi:MAG: hypothetical protein LBM93_10140 [Oscillospiraceae bacterium]|jgi:hypothetical protein|nr:hypothetical protein [Oscillospiraceae bacterium]